MNAENVYAFYRVRHENEPTVQAGLLITSGFYELMNDIAEEATGVPLREAALQSPYSCMKFLLSTHRQVRKRLAENHYAGDERVWLGADDHHTVAVSALGAGDELHTPYNTRCEFSIKEVPPELRGSLVTGTERLERLFATARVLLSLTTEPRR